MKIIKSFSFLTRIVLIALFLSVSIYGAASDVDQTFIATTGVNQTQTQAVTAYTALQPDGKILVFGYFNSINGAPRSKMLRLNADGTLDSSFNCACETFSTVVSAVAQADGKIVVAGYGNGLRFVRLQADGSIDAAFVPDTLQSTITLFFGDPIVWAVQPDGKPLISYHTSGSFLSYRTLSRLNVDGSLDNTFTSLTFNYRSIAQQALNQLQILPDGKIMIGGRHPFGDIFRINSNGTKDTTFESPVLTNNMSMFPPSVYGFGIQSTGKIVISGNFLTVNGFSRNGFARLNADGSLDLQFTSSVTSTGKIAIVSGDKILLGATRLNADGSADNTYSPAFTFSSWQIDALERILFIGTFTEDGVTSTRIGRMNADGSADNSFNFALLELSGEVTAIALQADGKVLFGGKFNRVNGIVRRGFARVNADGSLDNTFNPGSSVNNSTINVILVQSDGKILIGGTFQNYNGTARQGLARINSDGSLDTAFNPILASSSGQPQVAAITIQPDGKILIGGTFSSVGGESRTSLARLNADGSLDNSFNPIIGSGTIASLLLQSDGKVMIGGTFSGVNGFNRSNFVRLNADASLDSAFNAGSIAAVNQISQTPDGKYLVLTSTILRRSNDGSTDVSFPTVTLGASSGNQAFLKRFILQADGNLVVVGQFISINGVGRANIARIKPNGSIDTVFFPGGTDSLINTIVAQTDGKLIVGGSFSTIENVPRSSLARIIPPAVRNITKFDFDGDGRADISVFRPAENKWYIYRSSDGQIIQQIFALSGDKPIPADFDGDGKTDMAIYRPAEGGWWYLSSINNNQIYAQLGDANDIPLPSDFTGDGRADYIMFRPSQRVWWLVNSATGAATTRNFGLAGDKPLIGDFDGDGKSDVAIYRPSTGDWWWQSSIDNVQRAAHWGIASDIPAPADYDGDGKTDFAVYRPSEGVWYIYNSSNGQATIISFGLAEDKPVAADYDGDGRADIAVFRPSTGVWYILQATAGFTAMQFGVSTDIPTPNAFVP